MDDQTTADPMDSGAVAPAAPSAEADEMAGAAEAALPQPPVAPRRPRQKDLRALDEWLVRCLDAASVRAIATTTHARQGDLGREQRRAIQQAVKITGHTDPLRALPNVFANRCGQLFAKKDFGPVLTMIRAWGPLAPEIIFQPIADWWRENQGEREPWELLWMNDAERDAALAEATAALGEGFERSTVAAALFARCVLPRTSPVPTEPPGPTPSPRAARSSGQTAPPKNRGARPPDPEPMAEARPHPDPFAPPREKEDRNEGVQAGESAGAAATTGSPFRDPLPPMRTTEDQTGRAAIAGEAGAGASTGNYPPGAAAHGESAIVQGLAALRTGGNDPEGIGDRPSELQRFADAVARMPERLAPPDRLRALAARIEALAAQRDEGHQQRQRFVAAIERLRAEWPASLPRDTIDAFDPAAVGDDPGGALRLLDELRGRLASYDALAAAPPAGLREQGAYFTRLGALMEEIAVAAELLAESCAPVPPATRPEIDPDGALGAIERGAEVVRLHEENGKLASRIADLEANLRAAEARIASLQRRLGDRTLSRGATDRGEFDIEDEQPKTMAEAVQLAEQRYAGELIFLPSAHESAADSPYRDPGKVFHVLTKLAALVREWQSVPDGKLGNDFRGLLRDEGVVWKSGISGTTEAKYTSEYTFNYAGESRLFGEHVTLGARGANTCCSIHFLRDEEKQFLVVGWAGRHRRNTQT
ncbi:MAG: hypothetical protein FJ033_09335 [Chloroflexi bacterium]|nr:hypothetical protein [Chloroflexota bacterium]